MDKSNSDILIIGAGMAGLTCASDLAEAGRSVCVLDKGRGPGGRMAARCAEIEGETVSFDHGAQYFTARDPLFEDVVTGWEKRGVAERWPAAEEGAWVGVPGMNGPIRAMAEALDVRWGTRAEIVNHDGDLWQVETGEGSFKAPTLLVAIPAEQTNELLKDAAPQLAAIAGGVRSEPCWAVMTGFSSPLNIADDAIRAPDAAIAWSARNSAKPGRTGKDCWVLHASPKRSRELIHLPKEDVAPLLLGDFFKQAGIAPEEPIHLVAHRWLYAMPGKVAGEPARFNAETQIGITGDYLHSPRVEGAFLSGRALARQVLAHP